MDSSLLIVVAVAVAMLFGVTALMISESLKKKNEKTDADDR